MKKYDNLLIVPNFTSSGVRNFSIHRNIIWSNDLSCLISRMIPIHFNLISQLVLFIEISLCDSTSNFWDFIKVSSLQ